MTLRNKIKSTNSLIDQLESEEPKTKDEVQVGKPIFTERLSPFTGQLNDDKLDSGKINSFPLS